MDAIATTGPTWSIKAIATSSRVELVVIVAVTFTVHHANIDALDIAARAA